MHSDYPPVSAARTRVLRRPTSFAALVLGVALGGAAGGPAPFQDGDRVCFVGDSITKQGGYHAEILLFYATRFPSLRLQTWNCGIAGDTATGGLKRYDWDIAPHKPTVVTVMMGMNDVGRGYYSPGQTNETVLAKRREALERSIESVARIAARATAGGAKVLLLTPSPYDQTGQQKTPCLLGVNDALRVCGVGMRATARERDNVDLVEFNAPMLAINAAWQARDPAFTVVGPDRVHPGAPGHLVMAYLFLKAQGVSGTVSTMELDAATNAVTRQENCRIEGVSLTTSGMAFDCLEQALPFPVQQRSKQALELVPFMAELNCETLAVRNLAAGKYELRIDGKAVCDTTSVALAEGINLAELTDTPQYQQAAQVAGLVARRHALETKGRAYALLKQQFFPERDNLTPAAETEILKKNLEKLKGKGGVWNNYRSSMIEGYLAMPGGRAAAQEQCDKLLLRIHEASVPVRHHYEFVRAGAL